MNQDKVMLLIDADNVSIDVIEQAVAWVGRHFGGPHVRRAYCTAESAVKHQGAFKRLGIRPMVNLAAGKNSTDIALAVDAIDLAVAERPDVMVIASSDSDFAPLVGRLREKGCKVVGVGQRGKTGDETRMVYDDFEVMDHRKGPARQPSSRRAGSSPAPSVPSTPSVRSAGKVASSGVAPVATASPPTTPSAPPAPKDAPAGAPVAAPVAASTSARRGRVRRGAEPPVSAEAEPETSGAAIRPTGEPDQPPSSQATRRTRSRKSAAAPKPVTAPAPAAGSPPALPQPVSVEPVRRPQAEATAEPATAEARRPRRRRSGRSRGPKAEGGAPAAD